MHKFLVDTASENCDQVDVIVCVRPDQTVPGPVRVRSLQEMRKGEGRHSLESYVELVLLTVEPTLYQQVTF